MVKVEQVPDVARYCQALLVAHQRQIVARHSAQRANKREGLCKQDFSLLQLHSDSFAYSFLNTAAMIFEDGDGCIATGLASDGAAGSSA